MSSPHARIWTAGVLLILAGELLKLPACLQPMSDDVWLYFHAGEGFLYDVLPYRDRVFPYPPYSILWFLPPLVSLDPETYSALFSMEMLIVDLVIQLALLRIMLKCLGAQDAAASGLAVHCRPHFPALNPVLVATFVYVTGSVALRDVILTRFDLAPTALTMAAVLAFSRRHVTLSGCLVAMAAGTKLYPALLAIPLAVLAWRQRTLRYFLMGCLVGVLPLLILGFILPWWDFASMQLGRGMQVESLAASVVWFFHQLFGAEAAWTRVPAGFELTGALPTLLMPWPHVLWLAICLFSTWLAAGAAARASEITLPLLVRILTLPVLGFLTFAPVLSPQFLIWLLPAFTLAAAEGAVMEAGLFVVACCLTPVIFPTPQYLTGLNTFQALILLLRNLILCFLWVKAAKDLFWSGSHRYGSSSSEPLPDYENSAAS